MKPACLAGALVLAYSCLAIAQVATLQIKILEGDGASYAPGARTTQPLSVQIADERGNPVGGAAVSFRLPDDGPGGLFANGLRTEIVITDPNGRATVRHLHLNNTPGEFSVRITAAREQAHAGTLLRLSIAGASSASAAAASERPAVAKAKSNKKWIVLGLLVAGVAGGVGAGVATRPSATAPHPPPAPPVTIGPPTVSIGSVTWGH
jgi:hypothetical protein